jgi:predicted protein tyrosine phosphatase
MFTFRIEGAFDAEQLLDKHKWPTRTVTVIQRGADWYSRGPSHLVVPMSDVGSPLASKDAPTEAHMHAIFDHCEGLTDDDRVLVNCWLGQSRSSATMLGILILYGMEPQEALDAVIEQRPVAMPNLLICKHIDSIFGLGTETYDVTADYVGKELRKVGLAPDKPTTAAVAQMNDIMKLFK